MKPRLTITVDELVLHGFPPTQRYAVADAIARALEAELSSRVMRPPAPAARVDAGRVPIARADQSCGPAVGRALAQALSPRGSTERSGSARGGK